MFKTEKDALVCLYKFINYGIAEKNSIGIENNHPVEIIEYNYDLAYDLNKMFNILPQKERNILYSFIHYGNKLEASKAVGIPYTTYQRKLKKSLELWKKILKKNDYLL